MPITLLKKYLDSQRRERLRQNNRAYRMRHPERSKEQCRRYGKSEKGLIGHLRRRYGISLEQYNEKLAEQDGKCAGCGGPPVAHGMNRGIFCVDHDHITNQVRGLLCFNCNVLLGHAKDKIDTLKKLVLYLEQHAKL